MLPGFLKDSYKQYKDDTAEFIDWLLSTAQACGFQANVKSAPVPAAKTGRLKGKARKEAKAAATGSKTSSTTPQEQIDKAKYAVSVKDLLACAEAVAKFARPKIQMPRRVLRVALRAVDARRKCTAWFTKHSLEKDKNKTHSYFADRFEEVLQALSSCVKSTTVSPPDTAAATSYPELANSFAGLNVDDILEEDEADNGTEAVAARPSSKTYVLESSQEDTASEEMVFAIYCLYQDFSAIKLFIDGIWKDVKAQKIDITTAAVTTNMGFELARRIDEDLRASYPSVPDYLNTIGRLLQYAAGSGVSLENVDDLFDEHLVEWLFSRPYQLLISFCDVVSPMGVPLIKRGHFGVYNPEADRSQMSISEKSREDLIILMETLPEFCALSHIGDTPPAEDELTTGLRAMCKTKVIPAWLPFATQVFLDIHHTLRSSADLAFQELTASAKAIKATVENFLDFSRDITAPTSWAEGNNQIMRHLIHTIDTWVLKDVALIVKAKAASRQPGLDFDHNVEEFYLFRRHPVLCGVLTLFLRLCARDAGATVVDCWGTAIMPAHLYNILRLKQNPIPPWHAMDVLLGMHNKEHIFVGAPPTTPNEAFKRVCLAIGMSPQSFARHRRLTGHVASKKGPRGLGKSSALLAILTERYCTRASAASTLYDIEALLIEQSSPDRDGSGKPKQQKKSSTGLTAIQFLDAFHTSLASEQPKLLFDYFAFHCSSITLLRELRKSLHSAFVKYLDMGTAYVDNESQLPFLAMYVITIAGVTQQTAEAVRLDHTQVGSQTLETAGDVFTRFIGEDNER